MSVSESITSSIVGSIVSSINAIAGATLKFLALVANSAGEMVGVKIGTGDITEACTSVRYQPDHEGIYRPFAANEPVQKLGRVVDNLAASPDSPATQNITVISGHEYAVRIEGASGSTAVLSNAAVDTLTNNGADPITHDSGTPVTATTATLTVTISGAVTNLLVVDVSGQAIQLAPEYVTAKKVFSHANGNTVDGSGVVTEAKGADFDPQPKSYVGPGLTNSAIRSDDLVTAPWSNSGSGTLNMDAPGITGEPDKAGTHTPGAATDRIEHNSTGKASGASVTYKIYIAKRSAGSSFPKLLFDLAGGTRKLFWVNVDPSNGDTHEHSSNPSALTALETKVVGDFIEVLAEVPDASTNITVAFRGYSNAAATLTSETDNGTTGVATAYTQLELHEGKTIAEVRGTTPVFTSGASATVNATNLSFDDANHPTEGGYFVEWTPEYATSEVSGDIEIISLDNNAGLLYYDADTSQLKSTDGTNTASVALTTVAGTTYKIWVAYGGTNLQVGVDASTGTATSFDGAFASGTKIEICTPADNVSSLRNMQTHKTDFDNAVTILQGLSA